MRILKCLILAGAFLIAESAIAQDDFGNESVIALTEAGIGQEVLLAKIASLPCSYNVSTTSLVTLKRAGVANVVIAAMVDRCTGASKSQGAVNEASDPTVKRSPGLYIDLGTDTAHKLVKIRPTNASGGTVTGNGSLLFPFRVKLAIPRASAQSVSTSSSPKFFFYFETDDAKVGEFGTSATAAAQSPTEFSLIRFKEKNSQREILIRKQTMFVGSIGIDPKEAIQFSVEEIGDGAFKVSSNSPLLSGEYGFLLRAGSESYRIYDFHIP